MQSVSRQLGANYQDLADLDISYYDYDHANQEDDFLPLAIKMTQASHIILATPVYWYTVSAQLKTFIDRWSDLLTIRKDLGRKLKGKKLILVSCGSWEEPGEGFELPVKQTAEYMHMTFAGYFHTWITDKEHFSDQAVQLRVNLLLDFIKTQL